MSTDNETRNRLLPYVGYAGIAGATFNADGMSVAEALVAAKLNFRVESVPVVGARETPRGIVHVESDFQKMLVRVDPDGTSTAFPAMGTRYRIIQNVDGYSAIQAMVDKGDAKIIAAAGYGNPVGVKSFIAVQLPDPLLIGDTQDVADLYVIARVHHDGNATRLSIAPRLRSTGAIVETNIRANPQWWALVHSGDVGKKVLEAATSLRKVGKWADSYQRVTSSLLATRVTSEQFKELARKLLPTPALASDRSREEWADRRREMLTLFQSVRGSYGAGTAYAAYTAVIEYADYYAPAKGDPMQSRQKRVITEESAKFKRKAWSLITNMA